MTGGRGSVYKRGAAWYWHAKWQHQGGWKQKKKGGYRNRKEAEQGLTDFLRSVDIGIAVPADQLTVAGFLDGWLDHLEHVVGRKASTVLSYRITLKNALPIIGPMRMQNVTASDIDGIYRAMARRGLKPRTVRYLYSILRKAFGDAERQGIVATNVVTRSTPPSTVAARAPQFRTWTDAELARFLAHIDGRAHAAAITFAALTGCRRGEVIGLRWADLDLDNNRATIAQSVSDLGAEGLDVGDTKAHLAHPIALDDDLVAVLRRHRAEQNEWRLQVGPHWIDRDLVFPGPAGDYLRPAALSQQFERLIDSAGVPRIRFHDLRHGVGTSMARMPNGAKKAQQQLRHSSVNFTLNNYVHVSTDDLVAGVNEIARRRKEAR